MKISLTKVLFDQDEEKEVIEVLRSGWVMQGPKVTELEEKIAEYIGIKHAVAVNSGTSALHLALLALGIGPGDEVIVPSLSYIATTNCVKFVGATPVFADIDITTYNISPDDIKKKITSKTKAIIAVHQMGLAADMSPILQIAKQHKLLVIEDAACALGATYKGKMVGLFGDIACFSLHPRKSITTGEGGLIVTKNKKTAELLRSLRSHGMVKKNNKEVYMHVGYNFRMTDVQAAIGLAQFKKIDNLLKKRIDIAETYNKAFDKHDAFVIPHTPKGLKHTYQSYMIRVTNTKSRDVIMKKLSEKGIATRSGVMAAHKEPVYKKAYASVKLPYTEKAYKQGIIIPLYPQMTKEEQEYVIDNLLEIIA